MMFIDEWNHPVKSFTFASLKNMFCFQLGVLKYLLMNWKKNLFV